MPTDPPAPARCTVYYDGGCPLCRREIAHYRGQQGAEAIEWVDVAAAEGAPGPDITREQALARMHVRRADGSLAGGALAFAQIWSQLPRYAWLGRIASWPPVAAVLEVGYRVFLALRRFWRAAPGASR
ncbi:MAG: thiol-disulfide oxidoreductase DCC family protein [Betaproteobacteria bacterium]